jgi:negative regulator of flagellin synthesis FlgM
VKINPHVASGLFDAYRKNAVNKARPEAQAAAPAAKADKVELSSEAQRLQSLRVQLASLSDNDRAARIEELRQRVQSGTYNVDARALAEKLARSGILGS